MQNITFADTIRQIAPVHDINVQHAHATLAYCIVLYCIALYSVRCSAFDSRAMSRVTAGYSTVLYTNSKCLLWILGNIACPLLIKSPSRMCVRARITSHRSNRHTHTHTRAFEFYSGVVSTREYITDSQRYTSLLYLHGSHIRA